MCDALLLCALTIHVILKIFLNQNLMLCALKISGKSVLCKKVKVTKYMEIRVLIRLQDYLINNILRKNQWIILFWFLTWNTHLRKEEINNIKACSNLFKIVEGNFRVPNLRNTAQTGSNWMMEVMKLKRNQFTLFIYLFSL